MTESFAQTISHWALLVGIVFFTWHVIRALVRWYEYLVVATECVRCIAQSLASLVFDIGKIEENIAVSSRTLVKIHNEIPYTRNRLENITDELHAMNHPIQKEASK